MLRNHDGSIASPERRSRRSPGGRLAPHGTARRPRPPPGAPREATLKSELTTTLDLSHGWEFLRRATRPRWATAWLAPSGETVDLPHCWNADDTFQVGVRPYRGPGSYRRRFDLDGDPAQGVWFLVADGFYGTGEVWLNGIRLAKVDGQFLGFRLECGAALIAGADNRLGIRLTNRCPNSVLPGFPNPDFILHGGLAGRVYLEQRPAAHLLRETVDISTRNLPDGGARVQIAAELRGLAAEGSWRLRWSIVDRDGARLASAEAEPAEAAGSGPVVVSLELAAAAYWSPDSPTLYHAVGELVAGDEVVDRVRLPFGIRDAEFRPREGFFINGERVKLQGCNRHASIPGFGQALPEKLQRRDAQLLKAMGFNFVRLSHYPQHPAFLDACDELGILVYAEIATWKSVRCGRWLESALRQLEGMVLRDRNHPSVIIWGLGNESRSRRAYTVLGELARRLDPDRPVTYAENHAGRARLNRITGVVDVWSINYQLADIERAFAWGRRENVLVAECIPYQAGQRGTERELDHVRTLVATLAELDRHPTLAGYALWAFSDYATMHLDRYRRFSGIVDAWRIPKYAAMLMQARLAPQPFVRICGAWREPLSGADGDEARCTIHVFSNCPRVSLYHQGELLETLSCDLYASVELDLRGGVLLAVAEGEDGAAEYRLQAFAAPHRLVCELEAGSAGLRETIAISIRVVDEQGVQVTSYHGEATLELSGPARLHSFSADHTVLIARGEGRSFCSGSGSPGEVGLRASCIGLVPATARCRFGEGPAQTSVDLPLHDEETT